MRRILTLIALGTLGHAAAAQTPAMDFRALNAAGRLNLQGILGADFIDRFVLGLDYRDSVFSMYDRSRFTYKGKGTVVPFTMSRNFIFVNGDLTLLDGTRLPGRFVVDVGASGALALAKPFVDANHLRDRAGATIRRETGRGVGGVVVADVGRAQAFSGQRITYTVRRNGTDVALHVVTKRMV